MTETQMTELNEAIKETEISALNNINLEVIAQNCANNLELNNSITAYSFLPQYETLVQNYRSSFSSLFYRVLNEELQNIEERINALEFEDPILLLNSGYQSISWELERLYKYDIQKEIYSLLSQYREEYMASAFSALNTETMIWKTNQEVLSQIKDVATYPSLEPNAIETASSLLTNTLLSQIAFAEQRIRTKNPLELIYEQ